MAVTTRMANPSHLMVVNPTKGKTVRKRKTTKRRAVTASRRRRPNPIASKRRTASSRRHVVHARRSRRRANPSMGGGLIAEGVGLAAGSALTQFTTGMIPQIGGPGALADAARTAGVAYLLGMAAGKLGFGKYSRLITLGGMALAGGKLINSFLLPAATSVFQPKKPEAKNNGVGDIVTVPRGTFDTYYGSTPYFNTPTPSGMGDIVTVPRRAVNY